MSIMFGDFGLVNIYWRSTGERGVSYDDSPSTHPYTAMASFFLGRKLDADDMGFLEGDHDQQLIDDNYLNGVVKAWDNVKDKTVGELTGGRPMAG
jgi:hypothetical protein